MQDLPGLTDLLEPLPAETGALARELIGLVGGMPGLTGKVMRGWRSVNFRHARAGHVCAVFPHADRVSLYFEQGRLLADPEGLLMGDDLKRGRFLRLYPGGEIPEAVIYVLVSEAIALFA